MMEKIGSIGVDAGIVMIGDPCYTLPDDASHRTEIAKDWHKFCDKLNTEIAEPFGQGIAIVVPSGYGDGEYPVYVERNEEGRVMKVIIEFIDEEDEDEKE